MDEEKVVLFFAAFLVVLGFASVHANTANAASWGAKKIFTTPKKIRGVWYHKENGKIVRTKITAHTVNGLKLYKVLKGKEADKWELKLAAADKKADYKLADKVSSSKFEAYTFKFHGVTGFNADGWLAGGGDGYYYVPVKRTIKGKKVNALRVGEGAGNYFVDYAYQNKKLVK
ncbi:hypothetical protein [Lactobacillus helveticus]|uniref:hypothetical protein n=2 Tax=Lactobacillus helveticus TaxID=1587 RepID=UPI000BE9347D|nr:hypothetical protein [Lactobacillus helveticus]MCT3402819.1 hypothetical protein [Lactobacillus helveticus]NHL83436.1 hypothetical protein [Lactobacillus helveticus]